MQGEVDDQDRSSAGDIARNSRGTILGTPGEINLEPAPQRQFGRGEWVRCEPLSAELPVEIRYPPTGPNPPPRTGDS